MKNLFIALILICISNIINAQWQWTGGPPGGAISCIATKDSNIYASPSSGLYRSVDNGNNWFPTNLPLNVNTKAIICNDSNIFVGSLNHGIYKSTNYGISWTQINNGLTDTMVTSLAVSGTTIFAGTYSNGIFLSTNNGANWIPSNNGISNPYIKSLAVHDSVIYAGTSWWDGGVFYSTNNGTNWTLINIGLPAEDIRAIAIIGTNVFAGYVNRGVYLSINNSPNWVQVNNGLSADTSIGCFHVNGSYLFAGTGLGVYLTTDNGNNWLPFNTGYINSVEALASNDTYVFAATGGNGVWRRPLKDIVGVKETSKNINFTVYPNPATNTLNIESSTKFSQLLISDVLGNVVIRQQIYNHAVSVDVSGLGKGIYFVKMVSENGFVVKKFLKE